MRTTIYNCKQSDCCDSLTEKHSYHTIFERASLSLSFCDNKAQTQYCITQTLVQDDSTETTTTMPNNNNNNNKAPNTTTTIGWDPTRAFALYVPTPVVEETTTTTTDRQQQQQQQQQHQRTIRIAVNTLYSHSGTGCNEHELTALLQLLKAHDDYQQQLLLQQQLYHQHAHRNTDPYHDSSSSNNSSTWLLDLFRNYRAALTDCLSDWTAALGEQQQQQQQQQASTTAAAATEDWEQSSHNLELLRINYSVLHLSNIFLPLLPSLFHSLPLSSSSSSLWFSSFGGTDAGAGAGAASSSTTDAYMIPGLATAETVRYLRYNHISDDLIGPDIAVLLQAAQPETLLSVNNNSNNNGGNGEGRNAYWRVITKLVLRGCLELAYQLLSHHSLLVAAKQAFLAEQQQDETSAHRRAVVSPDYAELLQDIHFGFHGVLKTIFLCAPLPGGRTDTHDNNVHDDNDDEEDNNDYELDDNDYSIIPRQMQSVRYILQDLDVSRTDYKFWETTATTSSRHHQDVPLDFQPDAAKRKHRQWQDYIKDLLLLQFQQGGGDGGGPLASLLQHIPELQPILVILSGDLRDVTFDSWAEKLLAELLYRQPDISPANLSVRANKIAQELCQESSEKLVVEPLLHIMEGNAAKAIDLLFSFGAGSGAALPATLVRTYGIQSVSQSVSSSLPV